MSGVGDKITQLENSITSLSTKLATRKTYLESSFSSMDSDLTTAKNTLEETDAIKNLSNAIGDNAVKSESEPEPEP
jgi:hypothetical protein